MLRCSFLISREACDDDYRPVIWPIKYPYWNTAESDEYFHIVAFVDDMDTLYKQWPEAKESEVEIVECENVYYTDRLKKPVWYDDKRDTVCSTEY